MEPVEDGVPLGRRDTWPSVVHGHRSTLHDDPYPSALGRELGGVLDQVSDGPGQRTRSTLHDGPLADLQPDPVGSSAIESFDDRPGQGPEFERCHRLVSFDIGRQIDELGHQCPQLRDLGTDVLDDRHTGRLIEIGSRTQDVDIGPETCERGAKFMARVVHQLVLLSS